MAKARLDKSGLWIAKQGYQVEDGEPRLAFSPLAASQAIFDSGVANFVAWSSSAPRSTAYNRAVVTLGKTFVSPPLCYCMHIYGNTALGRELALTMSLGATTGGGGLTWREPQLWWESTTTHLYIYSWWSLSYVPAASYVITENTII